MLGILEAVNIRDVSNKSNCHKWRYSLDACQDVHFMFETNTSGNKGFPGLPDAVFQYAEKIKKYRNLILNGRR